jgi:[acyl-carrier-protein] S-malonyltransferase
MLPAEQDLAEEISQMVFQQPICPIYQNVDGRPHTDPLMIKQNLINQLTAPVRWTQSVLKMVEDGATRFTEVGPGNVLQGLVKKISKDVTTDAVGK